MDSDCQKVYINPNFNRFNGQRSNEVPLMHVNPAFSLQHNVAAISQNRIHVNPNFVKAAHYSNAQCFNLTKGSVQSISSIKCSENVKVSIAPAIPTSSKSRYTLIRNEQEKLVKRDIPKCSENVKVSIAPAIPTSSKSRYTLIRNKQEKLVKRDIPKCSENVKVSVAPAIPTSSKSRYTFIRNEQQKLVKRDIPKCSENVKVSIAPAIPTSSKSRYTLIRNEQEKLVKRDIPKYSEDVKVSIAPAIPTSSKSRYTFIRNEQQKLVERDIPECSENVKVSIAPAIPTSSKSRYTFIRNEQQELIKRDIPVRQKSTIAINKYKSVPVNEVKRSISRTHPSLSNRPSNKIILTSQKHNRFKFTGQVSVSSLKDVTSVTPKTVQKALVTKKYLPLVLNKYKYTKGAIGKLKKNNIPCPLYRKYGRCLRKDHGQCNYLHDKKHISLCRKFLKGFCHEKDCLLSHDLTSKKMPTCHFYLKGRCSKENCPYLHVKLNDDTKICSDFLKGYCEKGSECLKRHINMCPNLESNGTCKKKQCPYPHNKKSKKETASITIGGKCKAEMNIVRRHTTMDTTVEQGSTKDSRYYTDNIEADDSKCEIKPCRVKIGTLPSFIKL